MSEKKRREEREAARVESPQVSAEAAEEADIDTDMESLREALHREKERAEQHLAGWQRAQADFANYKKRVEQEKADNAKYASATIISNLLPVLDDLERALDNVDPQIAGIPWVDGIDLIRRKFLATLESEGLVKIEAKGKDFDPNYHQAVLYEEGEEGKVLEELQKGYMLGDRLLRPAMVKVGKGMPTTETGE